MAHKPTLKRPQPLTAAIIAYMRAGEERGDAQCAGLRVRCLASGQKVFFYRYRARDRALREIRLGEVGPLTLAKARDAALRKRLEREQGKDPQLEKRREREQATRERIAQRQGAYTLEDLINEYIDEVLCRQKKGPESARILRQDLLQVLPQNAGAFGTFLLTAEDFVDVLVDQVLKGVGALALRDAFAGRLLPLPTLLELRVLALLALQPFSQRGVASFGQGEGPDLAQSDLPQRAVAGTVAVEEDLLSRSQTTHPQSGTLCVTALLARLQVRDNRGRQGLRSFQCRFVRHTPSLSKDLYRHLH